MELYCRNKDCGKVMETNNLVINSDRKGKFVDCPHCGLDNNIPVVYKLVQIRMREDYWEAIKKKAAERGLKTTQYMKMAALSFVPPGDQQN